MSILDDLRRLGVSPEQVTVNGKPFVSQTPDEAKHRSPYWPYKSKAEQLYAWELGEKAKAHEIVAWRYEPITMVVIDASGERCRYTPDFMVLLPTTEPADFIEFHEVKGHLREAARLRFLSARERYPWFRFRMVRRLRGGGWEEVL